MAILSKACKPDNFELRNSLKLSFTNIQGIRLNFVDCESFLESNSPDILALCESNLDDSIDSVNFSVRGYLPLVLKFVQAIFCFFWAVSRRYAAAMFDFTRLFISFGVYLVYT